MATCNRCPKTGILVFSIEADVKSKPSRKMKLKKYTLYLCKACLRRENKDRESYDMKQLKEIKSYEQ